MMTLYHIARFKLLAFLKMSFEFRAKNIFRNAASALIFGGFAFGAYYVTKQGTDYLLDTAKLGSFLLHRFISMILFVYFISINVGNIIVSYATFYRSAEIHYYLTKPVSHLQIFLIKFFDNFFYSSSAFFIIALAVLLGYGSHFSMGAAFYFETLFGLLIPFMLIAACVAVIMLLLFVRYAARIGVKKMVLLISGTYIASLFAYFSATSPLKLVARILQHYPDLDRYFGHLDPWISKYLPNYWIAESLYWRMEGDTGVGRSYSILMIISTAAIFLLMVWAGKKLFHKSWLASFDLNSRSGARPPGAAFLSLVNKGRGNPQLSALVRKEVLLFLREPSQWIHLGIISMLILLFMVSISQIDLRQNMPFLQTVSYMVVLLFNSFLVASISLRFVYPSLNIEGNNFWLSLAGPVARRRLFMTKYWIYFLPVMVLSELLVVFSHRSLLEYPVLLYSAVIIIGGVSFFSVSINMGMGSYFADFKEKNPIRVASSQNATLIFLLSIVYLTMLVAVTFLPFNGFFGYILKNVPFEMGNLLIASASFFVISALLGAIGMVVGIRSLGRDF